MTRLPWDRPFAIARDTLETDRELAEDRAAELWQAKLDAEEEKVRERINARRRAIREGARER